MRSIHHLIARSGFAIARSVSSDAASTHLIARSGFAIARSVSSDAAFISNKEGSMFLQVRDSSPNKTCLIRSFDQRRYNSTVVSILHQMGFRNG